MIARMIRTQGLFKKSSIFVKYVATVATITSMVAVPSLLLESRIAAAAPTAKVSKPKAVPVRRIPTSTGALIAAGPSRKACLYTGGDLQPGLADAEAQTGTSPSCTMAYDGGSTWAQWDGPWFESPSAGFTTWVAADPVHRQLILGVNLIPNDLGDPTDPSGWEESCDAGQFDSYAQTLGTNLVAAGLDNSVIRLGLEMNGPWEPDFMGTTSSEQRMWATCFANEVTAMRQVPGEHFLFVWNPNACYENVPYANYYPGNSYVNIMGLDLYDISCMAPATHTAWTKLSSEPRGLAYFEAFANARHKPMSFPEWGLLADPDGDDAAYISGIGSTMAREDFSFETYFDAGDDGILQIGPGTPLSLPVFHRWFH
jgi:hypothetical protein